MCRGLVPGHDPTPTPNFEIMPTLWGLHQADCIGLPAPQNVSRKQVEAASSSCPQLLVYF